MEQKQNAAKRLLGLIKKFKSQPEVLNRSGTLAIDVWCNVFEVNQSGVVSKFGEVLVLIKSIQHQIRCDTQVSNKARYLSWVQTIEGAFLPSQLNQPALALAHGVFESESAAIAALEFCDEALSKSNAEIEVSTEDLKNLAAEAAALFDEVNTEVQSPELRRFLLELVQGVNDGIAVYRIQGIKGIDDALQRILGRLQQLKRSNFSSTKEDSLIYEKTCAFFTRMGKFSDTAHKIQEGLKLGYSAFENAKDLLK